MNSSVFRFGDFRFDPIKRELWRGDELVDMPPRVLACLRHLIEHRERAVDRAELIETVWHRRNVSDTQLFQLILRARRVVGDDAERQQAIRTIVGFGYRWVAQTDAVDASEPVTPAPTSQQVDAVPAGVIVLSGQQPSKAPTFETTATPVWRRSATLALLVALITIALTVAFLSRRSRPAHENADTTAAGVRVAVVPLDVVQAADAAWVRLGGMDLVADRLRRAGLAVQPSEATLGVVMRANGDADSAEEKLVRDAGVGLIVAGEVNRTGATWTVALHAKAGEIGDLHGQASDADLMLALRAATDRLLLTLGRTAPSDSISAALDEILQRSRAALLADDAGRARAILEQVSEPLSNDVELRLLLAQIDARMGKFEAAESALTRLLGDVGSSEDNYLRMRVLNTRGGVRIPLDRIVEAKSDFDTALAVPGASAFVHALGDAYGGRGATNTIRNDYAAAANDLGRARILLGQSGDALAVARMDLELALLDSARGAFAQAGQRFEQAARQFETFGAIRPLKSALIGLQDVQLDQMQNHLALATSDRAWATTSPTGDPLLRRVLSLMRARILVACGRLHEAREFLDRVDSEDVSYLASSRDDERLRVLRTEIAWREGRGADAARDAAPLPSAWLAGGGDDVLRAKAALWRQRALPPTRSSPGEVIVPSMQTDQGSHEAASYRRLAEAERARLLGQAADADRAYKQALALADGVGVPLASALVIESYVPALIDEGRLPDAAALAGRIAAWALDDFDCALLQLRLTHALGERTAWESALTNARRLAGERVIPAELVVAPELRSSG